MQIVLLVEKYAVSDKLHFLFKISKQAEFFILNPAIPRPALLSQELEVSKQFADHIMDSLKAVAKNPSESDSGFEGSVKHFLGKHRESVAMYKVGAIVYVEYICVLSLRQSQDPARVDKSRTLVCDTLAFLNNIDSELSSEVQPVLLDHAKKLLG